LVCLFKDHRNDEREAHAAILKHWLSISIPLLVNLPAILSDIYYYFDICMDKNVMMNENGMFLFLRHPIMHATVVSCHCCQSFQLFRQTLHETKHVQQ